MKSRLEEVITPSPSKAVDAGCLRVSLFPLQNVACSGKFPITEMLVGRILWLSQQ
jgi:hypothetical protein